MSRMFTRHVPNASLRSAQSLLSIGTRMTIVGAAALSGLFGMGCTHNQASPASNSAAEVPAPVGVATSQDPNEAKKEVVYRCPMHPEETSDKPGKCSRCGAELVAVATIRQ